MNMVHMLNDFIDCAKRYLMSYPILFNRVDKTFGKEFKFIINTINTKQITSHKSKVKLVN